VPRRRWLGHFQGTHQVAHAHLAVLQEMEDPQPRSVRERPKQPIDGDTCLLKHDAVQCKATNELDAIATATDRSSARAAPGPFAALRPIRPGYAGCARRRHRHRIRHSLRRISKAPDDSEPLATPMGNGPPHFRHLQMTGAALALGLLAVGGVTRASLTVVVLTGLMATLSVMLFGRRAPGPHADRRRSRSA